MTYPLGMLVCVRSNGLTGRLIRLGAALLDRPYLVNHVAVLHHYTDGVPWGIEGRPGGVGWVDLRHYLASPLTIANIVQARTFTDDQVRRIQQALEAAVGVPYDWGAIAADAAQACHLPDLFTRDWNGHGVPGHVVCSSLAAWAYDSNGLASPHPGHDRFVSPADWAQFILNRHWQS